jgi:hypothetical protein
MTKLSSALPHSVSSASPAIFIGTVGKICPVVYSVRYNSARVYLNCRRLVQRAIPEEKLQVRWRKRRPIIDLWRAASEILGTSVARPTIHIPNACLPTRHFHLQRQKFWIISPAIQRRRTRWMASFIGGCSTLACKNGRRKLRRPSRNSSNKVFSHKSDLQTATSFTTFHRAISRRFSNGHRET